MESELTSERVHRPQGWERRLLAAVNEALGKPFHPRDWNCATFAHDCAQRVRLAPIEYRWRGSLEESVDAVLSRVAVNFSQRGDVVLASVPEPSLGVCLGRYAVFVTRSEGLFELPMPRVSRAWAV